MWEVQCNIRITTKSLGMSRLEGISRNTSPRRLRTSKDLPLRELTWLTQCQHGQSRAEHRLAPLDSHFQHRDPLRGPQLSLAVFAFLFKNLSHLLCKTFSTRWRHGVIACGDGIEVKWPFGIQF